MEATLFQSVIVWTNALAPEPAVFAQALYWASRLHVPVQVVEALSIEDGQAAALAQEFVEKCRAQHLSCGLRQTRTDDSIPAELLGGPGDLLLFGRSVRPLLGPALHERRLRDLAPTTLQCSQAGQALSHLLILDEGRRFTNRCLGGLVEMCQCLEASPVVLTLASSEAAGQQRQARLQVDAAAVGLRAEFDMFVGHDPCAAVARVARWRHCEVVVRQRRSVSAWWHWLQRDALEGLSDIEHAPAILELPYGWTSLPLSEPVPEPTAETLPTSQQRARAISAGRQGR